MTITQLIPILQTSVAPCVLISGSGLLLLAQANRLPRPIDRARHLCSLVKSNPGPSGDTYRAQLKIFHKRCNLLRNAVALNVMCLGAIATVILLLFVGNILELTLTTPINVCFVFGLMCLLGSLAYFLTDIFVMLHSLELEIKETGVQL